ncbi:large subunit ribosomal protein L23 [Thermotomaculum hydrothermale]|uniref:Large ribosomal subunit protein uL23 n=1 Tax=Thermotomaculum hydrothermale TaxID=981385 RepID=A0A7R6PFS4_9BACT|nr:50S ribosomal protein L23 [Thermotomaculum hydrothermale]BBB32928.1 large subunit ribosomal protein L23 [Thermotomaculum hydrothermale]
MRTEYDIILRPILSERSTFLQERENAYTFEVAKDATKPQIKKAVEKIFGVKVKSVRTVNVKGKKKRLGRFEGKRRDWKKAIVYLADKEKKIDFFDNV